MSNSREQIPYKRPQRGCVGDIDTDTCFPEVPIEVSVGHEIGVERINFGENGGDNHEKAHTEDTDENHLLLYWNAKLHEERNCNQEDH